MSVLLNLLCVQNVYVLNEDQLLLFFNFYSWFKVFILMFSACWSNYIINRYVSCCVSVPSLNSRSFVFFFFSFFFCFFFFFFFLYFFIFFFLFFFFLSFFLFLDLIGFVVNGFAWSKQRCTFRIFAPLKSISKWILLFARKRFSIH